MPDVSIPVDTNQSNPLNDFAVTQTTTPTSFGSESTGSQQIVPSIPSLQKPPVQQNTTPETLYQPAYDRLSSYFKKELNLELKPDMQDYNPVFDNFIKSHRIVEDITNNPHKLLEAARQLFPDQFKQDENIELKQRLSQEFGDKFVYDSTELGDPNSPSARYVSRMAELKAELKFQDLMNQQMQVAQQEQEAQQRASMFEQQAKELATEIKSTPEEVRQTLEFLKSDPNIWGVKTLYIISSILQGKYNIVPNPNFGKVQATQNNNTAGIPPSVGGISGSVGQDRSKWNPL